jgi:hypothetical protein
LDELDALLGAQLADCSPEQSRLFDSCRITPQRTRIERFGVTETVFVVARAGDSVLYYEDVEEGFNIAPHCTDGRICSTSCEQWELRHALLHLAAAQSCMPDGTASKCELNERVSRVENSDASTSAWILLAIFFWDKGSVSRVEILESADAINHAVPSESELECAIPFLVRHGLIEQHDHFFGITDVGRAMLEAARSGSGNMLDALKDLELRIASFAVD